jgi:hypothetical protein
LQEAINRTVREKNDALKQIGRERRQHDVQVRELKEKCGNFETAVRLRTQRSNGEGRGLVRYVEDTDERLGRAGGTVAVSASESKAADCGRQRGSEHFAIGCGA